MIVDMLEQGAADFPKGMVRDKRRGIDLPIVGSSVMAILDRKKTAEFQSVKACSFLIWKL